MQEDNERTTSEIIKTLGEDCDRSHAELIKVINLGEFGIDETNSADYEYHARQLIRAIFAYIEAVTFSLKAWSAGHCMDHDIEISPQERYFATDTEFELNEKGEVVETAAKISLVRNIRFAISMNRKANGVANSFDASVEWWACLKHAIKVRDRLTHPKMPDDLDISGDDIIRSLKAKDGFEQEILSVRPA